MNCYNDWADQFMDKAIDNVSGRLHEPLTMSEENAWRKDVDIIGIVENITSLIFGIMRVQGKTGICLKKISTIPIFKTLTSFICP